MTEQSQPKRNQIKTTTIPLNIEIASSIGIANFPTENYNLPLNKPIITLKNHQEEITFKNAVGKVSDSEDDDNDYVRKKTLNFSRVTIKPQNLKKRYFRLDIPVQKGPPTGVKQNKEKINFIIQFNQEKKGTLTVVDDIFDTQVEIVDEKVELTMEERIKESEKKLDARRREERVEVEEKKEVKKREK